jgi:hypothetical protein
MIVLARETRELAKRDLVISLQAGPRIIGWRHGHRETAMRPATSHIETTGRSSIGTSLAITRCAQAGQPRRGAISG